MSTDVALLTAQDLDPAFDGMQTAIREIDSVERAVATGALDEQLFDAFTWVEQVHALGRLREDADDLCRNAGRLEATIIRRCAELGYEHQLKKASLATLGRSLAKLSAVEFSEFLDQITGKRSLTTVYGAWNAMRLKEAGITAARNGRISSSDDAEDAAARATRDRDRVGSACEELLLSLVETGQEFTTAEAADKLAEMLGYHDVDHLTKQALIDVVSKSIHASNTAETLVMLGGKVVARPQTLTYLDGTRWVRVGFYEASLDQLHFTAALRRRQADELAASAQQLETLYDLLSKQLIPEVSDERNRCGPLWNAALREMAHDA